MKNLLTIAFIALLGFSSGAVQAQKLGYINSQEILTAHPKVKAANSELEGLEQQLSNRLITKEEGIQKKYESLRAKEQQGTITAKDFQEQMAKLQEEQFGLQQESQQLQEQLIKKREELFQPILDEINNAITAVAKEKSYTYIFDQAAGFLLYADESENCGGLVKQKLGL